MDRRPSSALSGLSATSDGCSSGATESLGRGSGGGQPRGLVSSALAGSALAAARQRAAQVQNYRSQFAAALEEHFAAYDDSAPGGGERAATSPPTPQGRAGAKASKQAARFRGVTRHKRTQRFESHIWEAKKQIYLGGFDSEALAAKAHDVMALRCKPTAKDGGVLNFPRSDYFGIMPTIEHLSREDVVTALRNYSKSQTSRRAGAPPPARAKASKPGGAALRSTAGGGVHKGARAAARRPTPAAAAPGTPGGHGLRVVVRRAASDGEAKGQAGSPGPTPPSSPPKRLKSFGGKVAPRPPPLPAPADSCGPADGEAAEAAAETAASPAPGPAGLSLRSAGTTAGLALAPSLRSESPSPCTPLASAADLPAPATPHASGGADAAAEPAVIPGLARVVGMRGQPSAGLEPGPSSVVAALAAVGLAHAGSTAAGAGASASCSRYLSELYNLSPAGCQLRQQGGLRSGVPRALSGAGEAAAALAHAGAGADADMAEAEVALPAMLEENSLTFSATDDAYLFSPLASGSGPLERVASPGCLPTLEHVNGTMLFHAGQAGQAGLLLAEPEAGSSAGLLAGAGAMLLDDGPGAEAEESPTLRAPAAPAPTPAQAQGAGSASGSPAGSPGRAVPLRPWDPSQLPFLPVTSLMLGGSAYPLPASPFALSAGLSGLSGLGGGGGIPTGPSSSPGRPVPVLPAAALPPPHLAHLGGAALAAQQAAAAAAAMHHHRGIFLHAHDAMPSLFPGIGVSGLPLSAYFAS